MENLIFKAYLIYLPIALGLTYYVAHILFKNGKIFMLDIFKGREVIAEATNKLFQVGFYLLNIGFALFILKIRAPHPDSIGADVFFTSYQELVEALSLKVGGFAIYLGIMLFFNLLLFFRGKRISRKNNQVNTIPVVPA